jgi:hypothetical protein
MMTPSSNPSRRGGRAMPNAWASGDLERVLAFASSALIRAFSSGAGATAQKSDQTGRAVARAAPVGPPVFG